MSEGTTFLRERLVECEQMGGMFYFRDNSTGRVIEMNVHVLLTEEWESRPQSKDKSWIGQDHDGITIAVKALI